MFKKNMTSIIVAFLVVFLVPIIVLLIPKNRQTVENAIVNLETGDIAIVYYNFGNGGTIELFLYDVEGTLLFHKSHTSDGGSHSKISFIGTDIHLYVSRTDVAYAYSREGEPVKTMPSSDWKNITSNAWVGWESKSDSKKYVREEYVYCYEIVPYPKSLLDSKCSIKIQNTKTGTNTVLLELK
jgi:hypothetical protein